MRIKTPKFWYKKHSWRGCLLWPLSLLYLIGRQIHVFARKTYNAPIPVICVGNLTTGGAGKTPIAIAIMRLVKEQKLFKNPVFLSRGYGGDEEILLGREAPVIVNANRVEGAHQAVKQNADLIIMDDGFQNNTLHKDLNILVINGYDGFGNGLALPAGPLRELKNAAISRADIIAFTGHDRHGIKQSLPAFKPMLQTQVLLVDNHIDKSKPVLGFAGLARPGKFKYSLEQNGYDVVEFIRFADHHAYSQNDLDALIKRAKEINAQLVTTEKDFVKLQSLNGHEQVTPMAITLEFQSTETLLQKIKALQK